MKKISSLFWRVLKIIGRVQLNLMLGLFYFLVLTPYAVLLRLVFRLKFLPQGTWVTVEDQSLSLEKLRRSF